MKNECGKCSRLQAELNGLRELANNQGRFILEMKKKFSDYSGENDHWDRLRARRGKSDKSS